MGLMVKLYSMPAKKLLEVGTTYIDTVNDNVLPPSVLQISRCHSEFTVSAICLLFYKFAMEWRKMH